MNRRSLLFWSLVICLAGGLSLLAAAVQEGAEAPGLSAALAELDRMPRPAAAPTDPAAFLIGSEDVLSVHVWREPELSGPVTVLPDGRISLPLVGQFHAAGLTPEKLARRIEEGLSAYVVSPNVSVSVLTVNSRKYFVAGQVTRPGAYPLVVPTTISQAIAIAGGFRDYADKKNISIQRGASRLKFNYKAFARSKNPPEDILLRPGDQVIVP